MSRKKYTQPQSSAVSPVDSPLDVATLRNLALQSHLPALSDEVTYFSAIVELLEKLTPANVHLISNIIRVIVDEQARES